MHEEISENSMLWSMVKTKENTVMKLLELKSKWKSSDKKRETVLCITIQNKLPKYMEVMPSKTINVF